MDSKVKYKLTSPVLMWLIVIAGGVILWQLVPGQRLFYSGMLGAIVLALGLANWAYVIYKAGSVHRKAPASVDSIDKLVTEGLYASVRHPMYASDTALAWCVFIFIPFTHVLAIVIWLTLVLWFWAGLEERMLEEKFMDDYRQYKARVPMLIPSFRKRQ